jgi:hypothetical protein
VGFNFSCRCADIEERKLWKHYLKACEACLSAAEGIAGHFRKLLAEQMARFAGDP